MKNLKIKYCEIPAYLHAGGLYRNLNGDDPESIVEIPAANFHPDGETAANLKEFRQLFRVVEYWHLDDIPIGVLTFCDSHAIEVWEKGLVDLPPERMREVHRLFRKVFAKHKVVSFDQVVRLGSWNVIMYVIGRVEKSSDATAVAARHGNLRLLKYFREQGFAWHEDTCGSACEGGHLDCLRYAHENDCPWDMRVFLQASSSGHLSCMQYALAQGLTGWDTKVCRAAALGGHLDC